MTELLPSTPEAIAHAAELLRAGKLVAFPTETVYGLGANALDEEAVRRIFTAKGRPTADPLIVHLAHSDQLEQVARQIPPLAAQLAAAFWPGPLTLILPKQPVIPDLVTSGLDTVAVRVPSHPVALALLKAADLPVAAPSANRFGHTSPTTAQHVWHDLQGRIDLILDGGETTVGVESTVLDLSTSPPRILRPGGVTREMLEAILGPVQVLTQQRTAEPGLPSPGLLARHYSPQAEMLLFSGPGAFACLLQALAERQAAGQKVGALATDDQAQKLTEQGALIYRLGKDLPTIARRIYAGLRWLDGQKVDVILCCDVEREGLGLAIHDRLTRAATRTIFCP